MSDDCTVYHVLVQLVRELKIADISCVNNIVEKINTKDTEGNFSDLERRKIMEVIVNRAENPSNVISIYESLKAKNLPTLDKVLKLIFMITNNPKVKSFISKNQSKSNQKFVTLASLQSTLEKYKATTEVEVESRPVELSIVDEAIQSLENLYLTRKYLRSFEIADTQSFHTGFLKQKSPREQELLATEDILLVLMGINGRFVTINPNDQSFVIDRNFDQRVYCMLERILPLAVAYQKIIKFLEKYPPCFGTLVHQALSGAVSNIQKEYLTFISELISMFRNGELNLQKLLFLKESSIKEIDYVGSACSLVCKEGNDSTSTLSILHNRLELAMSSEICLNIAEYLMHSASVPYFDMITEWIYRGFIRDHHDEFMIVPLVNTQGSTTQKRFKNCEKSYTLVNERVPSFLKPVADKILNAGKYLNILQQCGMALNKTSHKRLTYSFKGNDYYDLINKSLLSASKSLLNFIMVEKKFSSMLSSIRHYFLLDHGDFFVIFIDLAEHVLMKQKSDVDISKLDSLLEIAIRCSVFAGDPFSECLGITLLDEDLETNQLQILGVQSSTQPRVFDGVRSFAFTFNVEWPLSLIINSVTITKYQMIFRRLVYVKYCILLLSRFWKIVRDYYISSTIPILKNNYLLAILIVNKMLHFLQNFEYFMQCDVIEPNWNVFINQISKVESIDELMVKHNDFIDKTLKDSMLTHSKLIEGFSAVINLCYEFPNDMMQQLQSLDPSVFQNKLKDYHYNLVEKVASFVFLLYGKNGDHFEHNMLVLAEMLDFNYFYSDHMTASRRESTVTTDSSHSFQDSNV